MLSGWLVATPYSSRNVAHAHIEFLAGIFSWPVGSKYELFDSPSALKMKTIFLRYLHNSLHGVTTQKNNVILTTVGTSDLKLFCAKDGKVQCSSLHISPHWNLRPFTDWPHGIWSACHNWLWIYEYP